jgi:hypothetical protein
MAQRTGLLRDFLASDHLGGWLSWRPDALVLQLGHLSYWWLSLSLCLAHGGLILVAPQFHSFAVPEQKT